VIKGFERDDQSRRTLRSLAESTSELELLVLHGSRARGDHAQHSDWDFAYAGDVDELGLRAELARALGTDHVDLVDLESAGGLLRYRVARDGICLFERTAGALEQFCLEAIHFWLDAAQVIEPEYQGILTRLG
jgi:predicted nucleotidyltransferase